MSRCRDANITGLVCRSSRFPSTNAGVRVYSGCALWNHNSSECSATAQHHDACSSDLFIGSTTAVFKHYNSQGSSERKPGNAWLRRETPPHVFNSHMQRYIKWKKSALHMAFLQISSENMCQFQLWSHGHRKYLRVKYACVYISRYKWAINKL